MGLKAEGRYSPEVKGTALKPEFIRILPRLTTVPTLIKLIVKEISKLPFGLTGREEGPDLKSPGMKW